LAISQLLAAIASAGGPAGELFGKFLGTGSLQLLAVIAKSSITDNCHDPSMRFYKGGNRDAIQPHGLSRTEHVRTIDVFTCVDGRTRRAGPRALHAVAARVTLAGAFQ
jgi:hypothetical protein